ncbi:MAG TPA: Gfo/Idh/MocA family oxidoreductase [Pirellulales bacterium]|nr:Gfo/Idh/MocA family oxidoreductase [Pirellulales bacterium]
MSVTRRTFLQQSAAASLALSAAAKAQARAAANEKAASRKVVVGMMGTNGRGTELAKLFAAQPGVEIAYICDVDQNNAQKCASAVNKAVGTSPQTISDFRRILDDKAVDALVVATPDHWHGPATILGCSAGKHVYCEKPACHNPREGELMVEAARKNKRAVQLGTQRRSMPALREAVDRMQNEQVLGRLLMARANYFNPRAALGPRVAAECPATLDYALWQGPAPEVAYGEWPENPTHFHYHWHWLWNWGTGEVGNNGVHMIDVCRWGLGVEYPTRVDSAGGRYRYHDSQETPDTNLVTIECGDKAIVWEQRSWYKPGKETKVDGTYEVAFFGEKGVLTYGGGSYQIYDNAGKQIDKQSASASPAQHVENFLAAVRDGEALNAEIAEGVKSTLMCQLANIAYRTGRPAVLDPQSHRVADAEQMKLWSREYRPGWEPKV